MDTLLLLQLFKKRCPENDVSKSGSTQTTQIQEAHFNLILIQTRSFQGLTFCLDTIQDFIVGTNTLPRRIWAGWQMSKGTDINERCSWPANTIFSIGIPDEQRRQKTWTQIQAVIKLEAHCQIRISEEIIHILSRVYSQNGNGKISSKSISLYIFLSLDKALKLKQEQIKVKNGQCLRAPIPRPVNQQHPIYQGEEKRLCIMKLL